MKISQDIRSQPVGQLRQDQQINHNFKHLVQSQTDQLKKQELQQLMQEITTQGEKLARFRSFPDLVRFKNLIKGFLKETVYDGLELQSSHSFRFDGESKQLAIVKQVDEKLMELTDQIMNQEKKSVDLLGLIGEIKGLLINLYT